jgi:tetrapyrrole methylase family protein/MazG family protein
MIDISLFENFPQNTVVIPGEELLSRRHMPTPPNLTTAIRSPQQPAHLYEMLREEYPSAHRVQLIGKSESREITIADLNTAEEIFINIQYLIIPPLPDHNAFETLQNTVAILRGPHGCPWDKEQTHQSIRDDFLQEVYELLDGLDRANNDMILEELGDVLFHVVLQTQMAIDAGEFTMGDVISHVNDKIVYRHQHVFGNPEEMTPDQVTVRWEEMKQKERARQHKKGGLLDGISRAMPALSMAFSYQRRAAKTGLEWETEEEWRKKLAEEMDEFEQAQNEEEREKELGDILFCVVNFARRYKIDPESALRTANLKFYDRVHYIETQAENQNMSLFDMPREMKEKYWNEFKAKQKSAE